MELDGCKATITDLRLKVPGMRQVHLQNRLKVGKEKEDIWATREITGIIKREANKNNGIASTDQH